MLKSLQIASGKTAQIGCALLALSFISSACLAQNLIVNGSFELPTMNQSGDSSDNLLANWSGNTANVRTFGAYYVPQSAFSVTPPALDGKQIAYVNNASSISQNTGISLISNQNYLLTAYIGRNNTSPNALGEILLYSGGVISQGSVVGGTLLGTSTPILTSGQYSQAFVSYNSGTVLTGGTLIVELKGLSQDQVNFESVSLFQKSSTAVPEGGAFTLIMGGVISGSLFFRNGFRRKKK